MFTPDDLDGLYAELGSDWTANREVYGSSIDLHTTEAVKFKQHWIIYINVPYHVANGNDELDIFDTVAHEVTHYSQALQRYVGGDFDDESEAYTVGAIVRFVIHSYDEWKDKQPKRKKKNAV